MSAPSEPAVVLITGIQAAGKTTVAVEPILAACRNRGTSARSTAELDSDRYSTTIVCAPTR
jgi:adenylylsulfate kinase-like enzyme